MAEQRVALALRHALRAQGVEQPGIDAVGPGGAWVQRARRVAQVAEIVPGGPGKSLVGEFRRDHEHAGLVHERQPEIAVVVPVAEHAVMDEEDRRAGIAMTRPGAAQDERAVGELRIDIGDIVRAGLRHQCAQIRHR